MTARDGAEHDRRVLLLAPTRRDASTTASLVEDAGIPLTSCPTFDELLKEMADGAGVVIVPEEALTAAHSERLGGLVHSQPRWSDLPVLLLAHAGAKSVAMEEAVRTLGNVTVLERPLRVPTLLSAVRAALRARSDIQIRQYLAERARNEESLRQADQRKDEFLATLAHELPKPARAAAVRRASARPAGRSGDARSGSSRSSSVRSHTSCDSSTISSRCHASRGG